MNKLLQQARKNFKGQKVKIKSGTGGFDNSPFIEGNHTLEITESKIKDKDGRPQHYIMMRVLEGDNKGRNAWPFAPYLDDIDGVIQSAKTVRVVLGDDVVPGYVDKDGDFNLTVDAYLEDADDFVHQLIGEVVEARCMNSKIRADGSHLKNDGTPWQNWFINRGLGDDAKAFGKDRDEEVRHVHQAGDDMKLATKKRKPVVKKKVIKKKAVTKKKVIKKKVIKKKK